LIHDLLPEVCFLIVGIADWHPGVWAPDHTGPRQDIELAGASQRACRAIVGVWGAAIAVGCVAGIANAIREGSEE
jgi:hypothetical protein